MTVKQEEVEEEKQEKTIKKEMRSVRGEGGEKLGYKDEKLERKAIKLVLILYMIKQNKTKKLINIYRK